MYFVAAAATTTTCVSEIPSHCVIIHRCLSAWDYDRDGGRRPWTTYVRPAHSGVANNECGEISVGTGKVFEGGRGE